MIDKLEHTAKAFHGYHILLWDEIIKLIDKMNQKEFNNTGNIDVKITAFRNLFGTGIKIRAMCFGCQWGKEQQQQQQPTNFCSGCLFEVDFYELDLFEFCLNNIWKMYSNSYYKHEAIKYAKLIRDFPLKKEYMYD